MIGCFINCGNSCYIDSILFLLLISNNRFLDKYLLALNHPISELLREYKKQIFDGKIINCRELKKLLSEYKNSSFEDFSGLQMRDSSEFLKYLFKILKVEYFKNKIYTFGTNETFEIKYAKELIEYLKNNKIYLTNTMIEEKASPIVSIIDLYPDTISNLLNCVDDSGELDTPLKETNKDGVETGRKFQRRLQYTEYANYHYLVVNISRIYHNKVIPNEHLNSLRLTGIVIFEGDESVGHSGRDLHASVGHYYSIFRNGETYYKYDDLSFQAFSKIGDYQELIKNKEILIDGMLYIYE